MMSETAAAILLTMKDTNKQNSQPTQSSHQKDEKSANFDDQEKEIEDKENHEVQMDKDESVTEAKEGAQNVSNNKLPNTVKRKSCEYIPNKALRLKSYIRRRPIPLKRVAELDTQCGTKSFMCQICIDFNEVIYTGHHDLVKCFTSQSGLKLSDINSLLLSGRYQARPQGSKQNWEHDYNPAHESDREDEEFFETVKAKREADAAKQAGLLIFKYLIILKI